jgi:hypothetical protein
MSLHTALLIYGCVTVTFMVMVSFYWSWLEETGAGLPFDEMPKAVGVMASFAWPALFPLVIVIGAAALIFDYGPRWLVRAELRRRQRVITREAEAKKQADAKHYDVEQGPHR